MHYDYKKQVTALSMQQANVHVYQIFDLLLVMAEKYIYID
jgi:hypothetical protein